MACLILITDQITYYCVSETQAEPSLQATQMKLKRARLADGLNEKIAQRPGPMELVEKNILPVDSSVKEAITGKQDYNASAGFLMKSRALNTVSCFGTESEANYPKTLDVFKFDEDSSEALSPEDSASRESQCSVPSPREARLPEISSATLSVGSNLQVKVVISAPG